MYKRCPRCFKLVPENQPVHWPCFIARAKFILLGLCLLIISMIALVGAIAIYAFN